MKRTRLCWLTMRNMYSSTRNNIRLLHHNLVHIGVFSIHPCTYVPGVRSNLSSVDRAFNLRTKEIDLYLIPCIALARLIHHFNSCSRSIYRLRHPSFNWPHYHVRQSSKLHFGNFGHAISYLKKAPLTTFWKIAWPKISKFIFDKHCRKWTPIERYMTQTVFPIHS